MGLLEKQEEEEEEEEERELNNQSQELIRERYQKQ